MNFKFFNKELTKKVLAGTIAGIMTLSGIPSVVEAKTKNSPSTTTSISSNACYDEYIGEVETLGGKFKIYKRENSVYAEHIGEKFTDKITVFNDGTVSTSITRRDKNGVSTTSTEKFKINTYNGDYIDIETNCINSPDIKKCVKSMQDYINLNQFYGENYINSYRLNPTYSNKQNRDKQYQAAWQQMLNDLNVNNIKFAGTGVLALPGAFGNPLTQGELAGTIMSSGEAAKNILGDLALDYSTGKIIGTSMSVAVLPILIVSAGFLEISTDLDYTDYGSYDDNDDFTDVAVMYPESLGYEKTSVVNMLAAGAGWMSLAESMDLVINNSKDNDPNNDYFKTIVDKDSNVLFINVLKPLSIDEAAEVLKKVKIDDYTPDPNNIYTFKAKDAKLVIEKAGGMAGLGNTKDYSLGAAENHAFSKSYEKFDKDTFEISSSGYKFTDGQKPGIYFWHYHFYNKQMNNDVRNTKHIFFGLPIIITKNDIEKYSNGQAFKLSDLEEYKVMQVPNDYRKLFDGILKTIGITELEKDAYQKRKGK